MAVFSGGCFFAICCCFSARGQVSNDLGVEGKVVAEGRLECSGDFIVEVGTIHRYTRNCSIVHCLGWVGLGWVGLGWVGLGWVGLGLG